MYMANEEGEDVIPVLRVMVEGGTLQVQLLNERRAQDLKYTDPSIKEVKDGKLTDEMSEFLLTNMDGRLMTSEVAECWLYAEDPSWMVYDNNVANENVDEALEEEKL